MSLQKAITALSFVPQTDRETWVRMGMAVKAEFGEDGFDAWDQWSQGAESYNEKSAKAVWRSISPNGKIRIGTLFHEAAARGWRDNGEHRGPLTAQEIEDRRIARAARDAAAVAEEKRKERGYRDAAQNAQTLISACAIETHYYLNSKGLPDVRALVADGVLVVPMRNAQTNVLQGAQTIEWLPESREWEKKMIYGMRAKGAVFRLGDIRAKEAFLCEGYATGLSIELALRFMRLRACVVVCFSDRNLVHVAPMIGGRKFVFADHDESGAGQRAAVDTGLPYCLSPLLGEDANDLHVRAGLTAVCKKITEVRRIA